MATPYMEFSKSNQLAWSNYNRERKREMMEMLTLLAPAWRTIYRYKTLNPKHSLAIGIMHNQTQASAQLNFKYLLPTMHGHGYEHKNTTQHGDTTRHEDTRIPPCPCIVACNTLQDRSFYILFTPQGTNIQA